MCVLIFLCLVLQKHAFLYHQFALFIGASYLHPQPSLTKISECITELLGFLAITSC